MQTDAPWVLFNISVSGVHGSIWLSLCEQKADRADNGGDELGILAMSKLELRWPHYAFVQLEFLCPSGVHPGPTSILIMVHYQSEHTPLLFS